MDNYQERLSLLADMIAFSIVDGKLHEREYRFIEYVAAQLKITSEDLQQLFHSENEHPPIKAEFQRVQQFYRLALLMHIDGVLHEKEEVAIAQSGIDMGLNPAACKRLLDLMKLSKTKIIDPELLLDTFRVQHN